MKISLRFTGPLVLAACMALRAQGPGADLLIVNARVFTGVQGQPWAEALAIRGDRITAVGTTAAVREQAGSVTRTVEANGRLVIPGINDAHAHPTARPPYTALEGPPAFQQDPTLDAVIKRVEAAAAKAPTGGWLVGEIGASVLNDPKATRALFDPLTGGRPLLLGSWHGHGTLVNSEAMRRLRVGEQEPDPPGGFFVRMPDGRTVTGVAHEYADYILRQRLAMLVDRAGQIAAYREHAAGAASLGITSVQAMMTGYPAEEAARLMADAKLPVRMRVIDFPMTGPGAWTRRQAPASLASALVVRSGTKWILDGTPIERLMYLREPYTDAASTRGRLNFRDTEVRDFLARAMEAREQPMFHAVGDAAIDVLLDALGATGDAKWAALRPRIEHGDMMEPAHVDRAKRMGVVLVQNPSHFMLGPTLQARLGSRTARMSVVKALVEAGVPFAIGSDGPMNPYLNIMFAAINEVNPDNALSVEQSLRAYTRGSAWAEHMETQKGTIAVGMLADVAMLSQDIFKVPVPELPKTTSVLTVVGGRIVHEVK